MSSDIEIQKKKLKAELDKFKHEFKVELPKAISTAREYGDLKENAEYHAARERQSFVKAKIGQVTAQLAKLNELDMTNIPEDKIAYGSKVVIINTESDDQMELMFVSTGEVNPSEGKISLSSPFGAALQGKTVGDMADVTIPAGTKTFYIEKIVTVHGNELYKKYVD